MTNEVDYKRVIDVDLKWHPTKREMTLRNAIEACAEDSAKRFGLFERLGKVETVPPIVESKLYHPIFYAFQARAEWEVCILAQELGEDLRVEYKLEARQDHIRLDWHKLQHERQIWMPSDYLLIQRDNAGIFCQDETNCIGVLGAYVEDETDKLRDLVLYGPDKWGSGEAKMDAIINNPAWRYLAREYSLRLLDCAANRYVDFIEPEFRPVLEALASDYAAQMRK